ncbi:MAG: hypothetical protein LBI56_00505 [Puniceicoccales bacterium]|jgi:hypothetical protein|nr:hypothetical protein [Puniceicoccales bacterium]
MWWQKKEIALSINGLYFSESLRGGFFYLLTQWLFLANTLTVALLNTSAEMVEYVIFAVKIKKNFPIHAEKY